MALEGRIEIEFLAHDAAVVRRQSRQTLESLEQPFGLHPSVRFDIADNDIRCGGARRTRSLQHRVGLPDSRREAEENAQATALRALRLVLDAPQELIGIGP